jgi:hypothetical protein
MDSKPSAWTSSVDTGPIAVLGTSFGHQMHMVRELALQQQKPPWSFCSVSPGQSSARGLHPMPDDAAACRVAVLSEWMFNQKGVTIGLKNR